MSKRDYYEVLGVEKDVDGAALKKAFRRLAMKYHPDRNSDDPNSEQKFKEAREAFEVLNDPHKRAAYDRFGHAGVDKSSMGGSSSGQGFEDIFGDIFGDFFGGGRGSAGNQRGADLVYRLQISLEEAVSGVKKQITIPRDVACKKCNGSGAKPGTKPESCTTCNGMGKVRMQQGFFSVSQTCPKCQGQGKRIQHPCGHCRGSGHEKEHSDLSIKIPAGVDTGNQMRLQGKGQAGSHGGMSGDLYVEIEIKPHEIFKRDGQDLHCEVPISFDVAALGGELKVPSLTGQINLKIPPETQTGRTFKVRGKGVPSVKNKSQLGNLYCHTVIETPVNLNEEQKQLLQKFASSIKKEGKAHQPNRASFIDKVKQFFDA